MNHQQRHLTEDEWGRFEEIISPMKALTTGFCPGEIYGTPFISAPLITPSVMIMGYNPGRGKCKSAVWKDPHEASHYKWAHEELLKPKDKFLKLFRRCFDQEVWDDLIQPNQIDLTWSNLYPFHTRNKKELESLFDKIRKQHPERHPKKTCREAMARLIVELIRPKVVMCAGKEIKRELLIGLEAIGYKSDETEPRPRTKGVTYSQIKGIHIIGFSRFQSAGFYFDLRGGNTAPLQENCLRELTSWVLKQDTRNKTK